jgi:hypothetical protein
VFTAAAAGQKNTEDLKACEAVSEKLISACRNLEAQLKGNAAPEKLPEAVWRQQFAEMIVGVAAVRDRLNAAIRELREKQCKIQHLAASKAVDRSMAAAEETLQFKDTDFNNPIYVTLGN